MRNRGYITGSQFQEIINQVNEAYEKAGVACITRKAIPGKYIHDKKAVWQSATSGGRITKADLQVSFGGTSQRKFIAESKAEPDYGGTIAGGRAIYYDAKSTKRDRLDFDNLHAHQIHYLERMGKLGAVAGFLVEFSARNEIYWLPIQDVIAFRNANKKSIPYSHFQTNLTPSPRGKGLISWDYLKTVN